MGCDGCAAKATWFVWWKLQGQLLGSYVVAMMLGDDGVVACWWLPGGAAWQLVGSYAVAGDTGGVMAAWGSEGPAMRVAARQLGANGLG